MIICYIIMHILEKERLREAPQGPVGQYEIV